MKKYFLLMTSLLTIGILSACSSDEATTTEATDKETKVTVSTDENAIASAKAMFQPLGEVPVPEDNPITDEKVELGKRLFFDSRLSGNNVQSCSSCHQPQAGYGDNLATFIGFEGFKGPRNSPTIINSAYYSENFWDGRASSLEEQAKGPITAAGEMNQDLDGLVGKLKAVPAYVTDFQTAFGEEISVDNILKAIATFERKIVVKDTAFDKYLAGDDTAISDEAKNGMVLYTGKASCITCHATPTLSDGKYYNLGIEGDEGRYAVTNNDADKGAFRTASLRGITHTAPYMHDGSLATLKDVVEFYNKGGGTDTNKSELIQPLGLTDEEINQLVAFIETLGGEVPVVEAPEAY
ncbi:cytochrome c peroxidase [Lysinibacillus sp. NPDC097231]|uniref:cytochrome-c peroxidase n=1 Tax=Lysinibacillus sp. NPDC097231 TaxID=3364142 RepID=UPI00380CC790